MTRVPLLLLAAVLVAGCSDSDSPAASGTATPTTASPTTASPTTASPTTASPTTASPSPVADAVVVAIGDSLPYNAPEDCPGCTGFVDGYAATLDAEARNRSRHDGAQTADIDEQLASGDLTEDLAVADVVIVSIGFNDQPPYVGRKLPCGVREPATESEAATQLAATTRACVDDMTARTGATAASVLTAVRTQAPDAAVAVVVPYNAWTGWPQLAELPPATQDTVNTIAAYALDRWRETICAAARSVDAICVDAYRAFNGPRGTRPSSDLLSADYTHPSQRGNDLIRDLLVDAALLS